TGRDRNGGYAEYAAIPSSSIFPIPDLLSDEEAAPLLCAGAIGYRSLLLSGVKNGESLGLLGFGASSHLILKLVKTYFQIQMYLFSPEIQMSNNFQLSWEQNGPVFSMKIHLLKYDPSLIPHLHGNPL
ncbi:hypothetical protein ACFLXB_06395, partial [Chloroflexota bacterium]